jgi:phenylacetate-CoA ligase
LSNRAKLFNEGGINPDKIKTLEDLRVLPILTKDMVKANLKAFLSSRYSVGKIKIHMTGGTTGAGLSFYTSDSEEAEQWAVWWQNTVPLSTNNPPYWRINTKGKQVF